MFRLQAVLYMEDVSWHDLRMQLHVVSRALPAVRGVRKQVRHLKRLLTIKAQHLQVQVKAARLAVVWIEIDDNQQTIGQVLGTFAITEQCLIVSGMKAETPIVLQGAMGSANVIHSGNEVFEVIWARQRPMFQLILLGV